MNLDPNELARRDQQHLQLRTTPLRVRWRLDQLVTSDAHRLVCDFSCAVRLLDQAADRQMLEEALLAGRQRLMIGDLVDHFQPALASAATSVASRHTADEWLDSARPAMCDALRAAAAEVAFSCGVEILPPFQLDAHSPTLQQQILESSHRRLVERRAAGQAAHFQHAVQLLQQFESLRQVRPDLRFGQLLQHISPSDQAPLLAALAHANAEHDAPSTLYVVAGTFLITIDAHASSGDPGARTTELPNALGPLRSVQRTAFDGQDHLLVGARGGVITMPARHPDAPITLADPDTTSTLGFSRALFWNSSVWACHGEAGLVGWSLREPSAPRHIHRPAQIASAIGLEHDPAGHGPRHLVEVDDARLIFAMGGRLLAFDRNGDFAVLSEVSRDPITGIIPATDELVIVRQSGVVERRRRDSLESIEHRERRGQRIIAAAALPWLAGEVRILLADDRGAVTAIGLDDALITQYLSDHQGARMLAAGAGVVAAASMDRQRLLLWNSWDPGRPRAELHIAAQTRHRIADIEIA